MKLQVGDQLAFNEGRGTSSFWSIYRIDRITPSGRIRCGHYELNPDLTVRGRDRWSSQPHHAELVTDEIRESIERRGLIYQVAKKIDWSKLSNDQLKQVLQIVREEAAS